MSVAIRHDDLRKRNRAMVIAAVRRGGRLSRTGLAAATGLSHSTMSAISSDLIGEGILTTAAVDSASPRRGRPQVALALDPRAASVAAIVLSLNSLSAAIIDYSGQVLVEARQDLHTLTMPKADVVTACTEMVRRLTSLLPGSAKTLQRICLAVQGTADAAGRAMLWSPITPHADIDFAAALEREFGVPAAVENDCNMMATALRWRDPERYRDDFVTILLAHGIGMGLVLNGRLFTGTRSSAGEFGHMIHRPGGALCRCGSRGCVEAYAGDYAIWRSAMGRGEQEMPREAIGNAIMLELAERARAADGPERQAYRQAGEALGYGLGSLFALIDPAPVVFVGGGAAAFDLMQRDVRAAIERTAGGRHAKTLPFATEADELKLTREGCALQALTFVDAEIFAPGEGQPRPGAA